VPAEAVLRRALRKSSGVLSAGRCACGNAVGSGGGGGAVLAIDGVGQSTEAGALAEEGETAPSGTKPGICAHPAPNNAMPQRPDNLFNLDNNQALHGSSNIMALRSD